MDKLNFRTLRADEIECRVGQVINGKNGWGCTLLLYKDARVDMALLDEVVGAFNWKREHSRDNANCIVSIYDNDKKEWVSKEDTGTESNTEKEKGLASDSFKRACVNWGIGRELYTSPFIWITLNATEVTNDGKAKFRKGHFKVTQIECDENRQIVKLAVSDEDGVVRYTHGLPRTKAASKPASAPAAPAPKPAHEQAKEYLASNPAAFTWFQDKYYSHVGSLEDFTTQELNNIYGVLHSNGKI